MHYEIRLIMEYKLFVKEIKKLGIVYLCVVQIDVIRVL